MERWDVGWRNDRPIEGIAARRGRERRERFRRGALAVTLSLLFGVWAYFAVRVGIRLFEMSTWH